LADLAREWRSAYVHVPFCGRVCPYCDFAVVAGRDDLAERYVAAVAREIDDEASWHPLDAVFVGGGTPSRVAPLLGGIVDRLRRRFGLGPGAEVTLEANPEDWSRPLAAALVEAGFTRVSFGAQSFDPVVLATLGRCHTPEEVEEAVVDARRAGFLSVNIDLIFGTPGESLGSWRHTVERGLATGCDHVSHYALTVEPGTALSRAVRAGAPAPDPDDQADKWELADELLAGAGLVRYEVSNRARAGHHCRYNLAVWGQGEYLGFGLGAHGFRDGMRSHNVGRLDTYLERVESGIGPLQGADRIDGWAAELERLMLGLRRTAGASTGRGGAALLASDDGRRLLAAGVLTNTGERIVVTRPLLTDEAVRSVLALPPPEGFS
jgi:oxygen-independent coproporphyrinogen-3 oxidase